MQKRLSVDVVLNNFKGLKHQMIQISTLKSANQCKIRQAWSSSRSTRIVRVLLALNILRNCFLLHLCTCIDVNDVHDVLTFCDLQAVNESVCLTDEGKYGVKTKADV